MDDVLEHISSFIFHVVSRMYDKVELSSQSQVGPLLFSRLVKAGPVIFMLWLVSFVFFLIYHFIEVKKKQSFCFYWKKTNFIKL